MKRKFVIFAALLLSGCVATTEVKEASSQVGVALNQLAVSKNSFQDVYLSELQEVRDIAAAAIESQSVVDSVEDLKQQEIRGDLIEISRNISSDRKATRQLAAEVMAISVGVDQDTDKVLAEFFKKKIDALRKTAKISEDAGNTVSSQELRAEADALEKQTNGEDTSNLYKDLNDLLMLSQAEKVVANSLKEFDQYIQFLKLVHTGLDDWISTDVTVNGSNIANLLIKAEGAN